MLKIKPMKRSQQIHILCFCVVPWTLASCWLKQGISLRTEVLPSTGGLAKHQLPFGNDSVTSGNDKNCPGSTDPNEGRTITILIGINEDRNKQTNKTP